MLDLPKLTPNVVHWDSQWALHPLSGPLAFYSTVVPPITCEHLGGDPNMHTHTEGGFTKPQAWIGRVQLMRCRRLAAPSSRAQEYSIHLQAPGLNLHANVEYEMFHDHDFAHRKLDCGHARISSASAVMSCLYRTLPAPQYVVTPCPFTDASYRCWCCIQYNERSVRSCMI